MAWRAQHALQHCSTRPRLPGVQSACGMTPVRLFLCGGGHTQIESEGRSQDTHFTHLCVATASSVLHKHTHTPPPRHDICSQDCFCVTHTTTQTTRRVYVYLCIAHYSLTTTHQELQSRVEKAGIAQVLQATDTLFLLWRWFEGGCLCCCACVFVSLYVICAH